MKQRKTSLALVKTVLLIFSFLILQMLLREGAKVSEDFVINDNYCYSASECVEVPLHCLPPRHFRLSCRLLPSIISESLRS